MITDSQAIEKGLLSIIKEVFSFWVDPKNKEKKTYIKSKTHQRKT